MLCSFLPVVWFSSHWERPNENMLLGKETFDVKLNIQIEQTFVDALQLFSSTERDVTTIAFMDALIP